MARNALLLATLFFTSFSYAACAKPDTFREDTVSYRKNQNYQLQTGLYDIYKTREANIVMLGNSITHGVNWNELMGRNDIIERGIPSDVLSGFLNRLEYVYKLKPRFCFVMGGINDIYSGYSAEDVFNEYMKVIEGLRSQGITPVIQSTLYVSPKWHDAADKNPEVKKLNALLMKYARDNGIRFMDLNAKMTIDGFLKAELTYDGLHLNANGYAIWREELEAVLK